MPEPLQKFLITALCHSEFQTVVEAKSREHAMMLAFDVGTEGWTFLGTEHTTIRPFEVKEAEPLEAPDGTGGP